MKRKVIFGCAVVAIILFLVLIYFIFFNDTTSEYSYGGINLNISTDDSDEDINWDNYETYEIELTESLNITSPGIYVLSGDMTGSITVETDDNVKIMLNGVNITSESGPVINVVDSNIVVIELVSGTTNYLEDSSNYDSFEDDVKGAVYSECDLVLQGDGILYVTANYEDGIVSKDNLKFSGGTYYITSADDAIRGRDSVNIVDGTFNIEASGDGIKSTNDTDSAKGFIKITNGTFNIVANLDGIQAETDILILDGTFNITTGGGSSNVSTSSSWGAWNTHSSSSTSNDSAKGIKAQNNLAISGGTFTFDTSDDALHSNGSIVIMKGTYDIATGDDGIHADETILIESGTINITKSYEGIEAAVITINDGTIDIVSSDDGINIAGGNDQSSMNRPGANSFSSSNSDYILTINGGTITIDASGDGIDVNGSAYIYGGEIYVYGPTDGGNGALDYDSSFVIDGGLLVAFGASTMAQNASSSSSQNTVMINFNSSYSAGSTVSIGSLEFTSKKSFSSVVISSSTFESNTEYSVYVDDSLYTTITFTNTVISNSNGGMNTSGGGGNPRR